MKRALACRGNRSSILTVSGEDLQFKTLRPARGEGWSGGRSGGWRPDEGRAAISEQPVGRVEYGTGRNGQRWAAVFGVTGRISRRRVFGELRGGAEIRGVSRRLVRGSAG